MRCRDSGTLFGDLYVRDCLVLGPYCAPDVGKLVSLSLGWKERLQTVSVHTTSYPPKKLQNEVLGLNPCHLRSLKLKSPKLGGLFFTDYMTLKRVLWPVYLIGIGIGFGVRP